MPSYLWPWPHSGLYWLGTGWWYLGLTHASLLCMSKICLLLMRSLWSGGLFAQSAVCPWLFMAWAVFWFPILLWLAPLRGWALFDGGLCLLTAYSFIAIISCHTILPFLLWYYLTQSCWASLGLPFILPPMAQYGHWFFYYITCGLQYPICFLLGILGPFAFLGFSWPFSQFCISMSFY